MSRVLIIAEHLNGQLNGATARCVSCATALKADAIDVLVLSDSGQAVAAQAAQISGVSKVLVADSAANAHAIAQVLAPQIAQAAGGYSEDAATAVAEREFTAGEYAPGGGWEVLIAHKAAANARQKAA